MTLDEAIKHCLEVAEQNETQADKIGRQFIGSAMDKRATDCRECAADHRQLAEWLMELKDLRNSIGAVKLKDMKEAVGLLQELNTENDQLASQLVEAKRLLKLAVEDFRFLESHTVDEERNCLISDRGEKILCSDCPFDNKGKVSEKCVWNYEAEALKLLNGEK